MNTDELYSFINDKHDKHLFKQHKSIEEINFTPGIELFQENNSVFLIYENEKNQKTRKVSEKKTNKTKTFKAIK